MGAGPYLWSKWALNFVFWNTCAVILGLFMASGQGLGIYSAFQVTWLRFKVRFSQIVDQSDFRKLVTWLEIIQIGKFVTDFILFFGVLALPK